MRCRRDITEIGHSDITEIGHSDVTESGLPDVTESGHPDVTEIGHPDVTEIGHPDVTEIYAASAGRDLAQLVAELAAKVRDRSYCNVTNTDLLTCNAAGQVAGDVAQPVTEVPCVTSNTTVAAIREIIEWGKAMQAVHYPVVDNLTDLVLLGAISEKALQSEPCPAQLHPHCTPIAPPLHPSSTPP